MATVLSSSQRSVLQVLRLLNASSIRVTFADLEKGLKDSENQDEVFPQGELLLTDLHVLVADRLVEVFPAEGRHCYRLTQLGRDFLSQRR